MLVKKTGTVRQIKSSDSASQVYYQITDHLNGQALSTDSSGNVIELTDYYPFGGLRLNEKNSGFQEQRKYIG